MESGPWFKVSTKGLVEWEIEPMTPGLQGEWLSTTAAPDEKYDFGARWVWCSTRSEVQSQHDWNLLTVTFSFSFIKKTLVSEFKPYYWSKHQEELFNLMLYHPYALYQTVTHRILEILPTTAIKLKHAILLGMTFQCELAQSSMLHRYNMKCIWKNVSCRPA